MNYIYDPSITQRAIARQYSRFFDGMFGEEKVVDDVICVLNYTYLKPKIYYKFLYILF